MTHSFPTRRSSELQQKDEVFQAWIRADEEERLRALPGFVHDVEKKGRRREIDAAVEAGAQPAAEARLHAVQRFDDAQRRRGDDGVETEIDRKSTRLNSSH